jgi:hypothetical protein
MCGPIRPVPLPPSAPNLPQDLASFGYWNLRAAMLNCLPVTMATSSKGHEHEHDPFEVPSHRRHEHGQAAAAAAATRATVAGAASNSSSTQQPVGTDAVKAQHPDTPGKQQPAGEDWGFQ